MGGPDSGDLGSGLFISVRGPWEIGKGDLKANLREIELKFLKAALTSLSILLLGASVSVLYAQTIPTSFSWTSTGPLISAKSDSTHNMIAVKDPSTVYYNNQYIVYASSVNSAGDYGMEYLNFTNWNDASAATPYFMDSNPNIGSGYHTAPQVFYFAPQNKWYLIFQSGQPQYSTNSDPTQPQNWSTPTNFFASQPSSVSNWIDFWIISDSSNVYLFFCGDNGNFYRSSTSLANFPNGFNTPVIVYTDSEFNLFEADNVYTVEQTGTYLANVECIGSDGHRFFRALTAPTLGGTWTSLGDTANLDTPFLGAHNVTFNAGVTTWTLDFSSGGAVIDGYDSTDSINLNNLTFLYQGDNPNNGASSYNLIPWQLGLASSKANITTTPTNTPAAVLPTATLTRTPTPVTASTWRVNAGGPSYTSSSTGFAWSADENFNGGSTIAEGTTIAGTNDSTLYDTQRYGASFSYSFNVPAGSYQVSLLFAETYSGDFAKGDRVFNVAIDGTTVLSNFDVYGQVGANTADVQVFNNIAPTSGVITITFTGTSSTDTNAMVEALQVVPMPTSTPTATMTPTNTAVPPTSTATLTASATASSTSTKTSTSTATNSATSTATLTWTNTPVPPTATFTNSPVPPTATRTNTAIPPTATNTNVPPTVTFTTTPMPPTATFTLTPVPPTPTDTNSPVPPTATKTNSPVPPTVTNTSLPATATNTLTPTLTPAPPTATNTFAPPTATGTFTLTNTSTLVPPTATHTPLPPTETFTLTPLPPTDTPTVVVSIASFEVQLLSGVTTDMTNSPHPFIQVVNTGTGPLDLNNVEVRYWFNCDCTTQTIQTWVDWAGLLPAGTSVTGNVVSTVQPTTLGGQTDYVSYKFTGNLVLQPGQMIQIQSRFNKSDWSNMNQANDWSFTPYTNYTNAPQVTGYLDGALVWGEQPAGASVSALKVANVISFPNPSTGNGTTLSFTLGGSRSGVDAADLSESNPSLVDPNAKITLSIYSLGYRLIWTETLTGGGYGTTGTHDVYWNERDLGGSKLANGIYFLQVTVESNGQKSSAFAKILILK